MNLDLFSGAQPAPAPGRRPPAEEPAGGAAYTVSQVNALARQILEGSLPPLWVGGEVSGWKRHPSGHCYFTLRDKYAQLRCAMFRADAQRLPTDPEEGMQVRALGGLTVYEKRGEYQLVVRLLEAQQAGGLWRLAFERLRAKLEAEGVLAPERKRPLPRCPGTVGVITSPVGAALHDILHVIERRAPWTRVVFCPAKVQGEGAAEELARAIRLFNRARAADVLIVGRGGGSMEDLWAFNEEVVARAIAASSIPVISAVGHEVDVTIADLVADVRAPTPTAAAERAVPDGVVMSRQLSELTLRLEHSLRRRHGTGCATAAGLERDLVEAMQAAVERRHERLARAAAKLEALSPLAALRRGYAVPLDEVGRILRRVRDFTPGGAFRLRVADGSVACNAEQIRPEEGGTGV
ncbi:MAG: exodeoxyribonuclease VII large subunit [Gemmatimonadetes bacterium]|nr:exodeoxyribonuclease VII large subunit [Gemmatimonadota bacterium]